MQLRKNYHDCYLTSITTNIESDGVELKFLCNSEILSMQFSGVKRCLFNDFTIGNIVLDVDIVSRDNRKIEQLAGRESFLRLLMVEPNTIYFQNILSELKSGGSIYVEISPSYGCSAQIICKSITEL